jgi:hypothetical protein
MHSEYYGKQKSKINYINDEYSNKKQVNDLISNKRKCCVLNN